MTAGLPEPDLTGFVRHGSRFVASNAGRCNPTVAELAFVTPRTGSCTSCDRLFGIFELKKANLPKGGDAKPPV
jgi:hypothetical protein